MYLLFLYLLIIVSPSPVSLLCSLSLFISLSLSLSLFFFFFSFFRLSRGNLVQFLCMDRTDEFQLVNFIIQNKGFTFIRAGLIPALGAFFAYWKCVNSATLRADGGFVHSCDHTGPGSGVYFIFETIAFVLQWGLVWIAFGLLPASVKRGTVAASPLSSADRPHGRIYRQGSSVGAIAIGPAPDLSPDSDSSESQDDSSGSDIDDFNHSDSSDGDDGPASLSNAAPIDHCSLHGLDLRFAARPESWASTCPSWSTTTVHLADRAWGWLRPRWPDFSAMMTEDLRRGGYLPALLHYDLCLILFCFLVAPTVLLLIRPYGTVS
jgi:hypothetical protein